PDLFASYARPGGSVTGIAGMVEDMTGKLVEVALEIVPGATRIGLLVNPTGANRDFVTQQIETAAHARGLTVLMEQARQPEELAGVFDRLAKAQAQAAIIAPNGMFINEPDRSLRSPFPQVCRQSFKTAKTCWLAGLASYGIDYRENYRRAALFVDKI